jgi:hypothetical protein
MRWRTIRRVAATALVGLVVPVAVGAIGIATATAEIYTARDPSAHAPVDAVAAPEHDPGKPTAVVVLGSEGANAADVLAPYEVLADTGAFSLYTAAPKRQPVPLTGNLDLVPDLTFAQLDQRLPTGPEVIVVPQLPHATGPDAAPVVQWLQRQRAQGDPLLVSVCTGAEVLAAAGLLDGRPAEAAGTGSPPPRQRPRHHQPMAAQPLAGLDATPGDPGCDPAPPQRLPAAWVVVGLVRVQLDGTLAGPTGSPSWP